MKYPPEHLYSLCKCIVDVMSIDYDYETFMTDFNKQPIDPLNAQIVYDVSFKCSMEEVQLMRMKVKNQIQKMQFKILLTGVALLFATSVNAHPDRYYSLLVSNDISLWICFRMLGICRTKSKSRRGNVALMIYVQYVVA